MFTTFDVISIGDTQIDTFFGLEKKEAMLRHLLKKNETRICFHYADKIPAETMTKTVAGNACNVAVGSRRLGLRTAFLTILGKDEEAKIVAKYLWNEKVDTRYITQDKRTNNSTVINYLGERTIFVFHEPRDYKLPKLAKAKFVYLTSMSAGWEEISQPLVKYLDKTGAKLAYNPGTHQLRAGTKISKPILERCHILFVNREEAALYTKLDPSTVQIGKLLKAVHQLGPKTVVITDGPKGSYAYDGEQYYQLGIFPAPVVERTGCGDAFGTGFMAAISQGKDLLTAMRWGSFESASVLQQIGPQAGLLKMEEIKQYEKKYPYFIPKPLTAKQLK